MSISQNHINVGTFNKVHSCIPWSHNLVTIGTNVYFKGSPECVHFIELTMLKFILIFTLKSVLVKHDKIKSCFIKVLGQVISFEGFVWIFNRVSFILFSGIFLHVFADGCEDGDEVVQAYQEAVFVVSDCPLGAVVYVDVLWQRNCLGKVDEPDGDLSLVVDKQQGAADDLVRFEEFRVRHCAFYLC